MPRLGEDSLIPVDQQGAPKPSGGHRPRRAWRRRRKLVSLLVAVVLVAGVVVVAVLPRGSGSAPKSKFDPVQTRALNQLQSFVSWLERNKASGYIGEVGWPKTTDSAQWNAVGEAWYQAADKAKLWVTQWTVGQFWGTTYQLTPYQSAKTTGDPVSVAMPSSTVLEKHPSTADYLHGVNASGGAVFGQSYGTMTGEFCNQRIGRYGYEYLYDDADTYRYLETRGVKLVRIPVRWERLQPTLSGPFDQTELKRLEDTVAAARAAHLRVALDIQNYGAYWSCSSPTAPAQRNTIGSAAVPYDAFANLWQRLSQVYKGDPDVYYDLMNEPVDMEAVAGKSPAQVWETASQKALDAIRANGDKKLVMVEGYNWSSAANWAKTHPKAWIVDPAHNFKYEAHQYFDGSTSGDYAHSYQQELEIAKSAG